MMIKKSKRQKKVYHKKVYYKNYQELTQLENKIKFLKNIYIEVIRLKENQKEFIQKNTILILKKYWYKKILLKLISQQTDFDEIYLFVKNPSELENQLLITKHKGLGFKLYDNFKAFIENTILLNYAKKH